MGITSCRHLAYPVLIVILCLSIDFSTVEVKAFPSRIASSGRRMLLVSNVSSSMEHTDGTIRADPLQHFEKYRGGYNLTNKHYWSSLIFTGICGYAIGISWLVLGSAFGIFIISVSFCGDISNRHWALQKTSASSRNQYYLWPVVTAFFLTVLALVAVGLVLGGSSKFHARASTIVEIVMDTANDASKTIYNTTGAMEDIKDTLEASNKGGDTTLLLTTTSQKLNSEAGNIERQARKNRRLIDKGLRIVYIITTVMISLNLVAVVALSVSGLFKLRRPLYWLIGLCWVLTVLCWFFFGMYFFLDKFSNDTCTALENFRQDPNNNSLSSVLPCDELLSAKSVLSDVAAGIYDLVNEVNANISHLQTTSYPNLLSVCNPFSAPPEYLYQPDKCPANSIRIGDIPKVLKLFTCFDSGSGSCSDGGIPISSSEYKTVEDYTTSVQGLLNAYPGMENLIECQSVKDAFSEILVEHCGPLKRYVRMVWSATAFLSVIMVLLVLIWTVQALQEQNCRDSDGSVEPHTSEAKFQELGKISS